MLVGVCVTGHNGADGGESDAGHGCNSSSGPHHPATNNTHILMIQTKYLLTFQKLDLYMPIKGISRLYYDLKHRAVQSKQ